MRRGTIAITAVAAVAGTLGVSVSTGSALDVRPAPGPSAQAAASAAQQQPSQTSSPILDSQSVDVFSGTAAYDAAGSVAATGWQMALGAYYLGGEFIETGRILGSKVAGMLGVVTVQTEPPPIPAATAPPAAKTPEDARLSAWSGTGRQDHTPALETPSALAGPATQPAAAALPPAEAITPASLSGTPKAIETQAGKSSQAAPSTGPKSAQKASAEPCSWPAAAASESRETEGATLAMLTDLGLMSEPALRLPDGSVFMPKVGQRLLQIRTGLPCVGGVSTSRTLVGHVIADPTASGLVQSSQDGRIEAPDWGLPRLGQKVAAGEILGYLRPIWSNRERSAMEAEISTLRGSVAEKELELARSRELPLLPFREGRILSIRLELDKLRRHRDALIQGLEGAEPITASASGVIARADARVGQVVEARHLLWEIVDEHRLWVEADWYGGEPPLAVDSASATRGDGSGLTLVYEGSGWAMKEQSTPLQFRVDRPAPGLRVGERVTVLVRQPVEAEGVLVPRSALIRRGNGETGVWAAIGAERFEPLRVRWKPVDGSVVAIEAGLPEGTRVVVSGATLLSEVR